MTPLPDKPSSWVQRLNPTHYGSPAPTQGVSKGAAKEEKELQKLCEQDLSRWGIEYLHLSYRAREKKGWPDLTFVMKGIPYAVELKSERGTLSQDQLDCIARLQANGWHCYVCRSHAEWRKIFEGVTL